MPHLPMFLLAFLSTIANSAATGAEFHSGSRRRCRRVIAATWFKATSARHRDLLVKDAHDGRIAETEPKQGSRKRTVPCRPTRSENRL